MSNPLKSGLPVNVEAEQFVLGSALLNDAVFPQAAAVLSAGDFHLEKHRRIFARMLELYERSEKIEYLTVANELMRHGQLESCDGVAYLSSLTEGLPRFENIDSYVRIVKEKAARRRVIYTAHRLIGEAGTVDVNELLGGAEAELRGIGEGLADRYEFQRPGEVIESTGGMQRFFNPQPGLATPWTRVTE